MIAFKNNNYSKAIELLETELNPINDFYKERLIILRNSAKALNDNVKILDYNHKLNNLN